MSWLSDYIRFTEGQESPELFHLWTGLTVMAATLGRRIWMDRRSEGVTRYRIYPGQLMTVLIGGSAQSKKTTASDTGYRLLNGLDIQTIRKITPEKLLRKLASHKNIIRNNGRITEEQADAVAFIYADELATFLGRQNYNEAMVNTIIKLFNAADDDTIDSIGGGEFRLKNICVTMLATTTPLGLGESVSGRAHSADLLGRIAFVYSRASGKINPLTDIDDEDVDPKRVEAMRQLESNLRAGLMDMQRLSGPIRFTRDGRRWFDSWYRRFRESPESEGEGWPGRRPDHLLRTATLFRVSEKIEVPILDDACQEAADLLLKKIEVDFPRAFQFIGQSNIARLCDRITDTIKRNGGRMPTVPLWGQVYKYFGDIDEFKRALAMLGEAGLIKRDQVGTTEFFYLVGGIQ